MTYVGSEPLLVVDGETLLEQRRAGCPTCQPGGSAPNPWHGRAGDLGRLVDMVRDKRIDGMFPLEEFGQFEHALRDAAVRVRLLEP